jgi:hypothetical protein
LVFVDENLLDCAVYARGEHEVVGLHLRIVGFDEGEMPITEVNGEKSRDGAEGCEDFLSFIHKKFLKPLEVMAQGKL